MRYRLRTLIILMAVVPIFVAVPVWIHSARQRARELRLTGGLRQLTPAEMAKRAGKPLKPATINLEEQPSD